MPASAHLKLFVNLTSRRSGFAFRLSGYMYDT
jgi:hypothetical protein